MGQPEHGWHSDKTRVFVRLDDYTTSMETEITLKVLLQEPKEMRICREGYRVRVMSTETSSRQTDV